MYVKLNCFVKVETADNRLIRFDSMNSCSILRSIDKVESTATLKIPTSAQIVYKGEKAASVQTAKQFRRGDKITINLGYDDRLHTEFEGFISKVNLTTPCELECMGYEYLLLSSIKTKTFAETNLKKLLQYIIEGKDIILDADIPEVNMKNYVIPANLTGLDALNQIKERYGITIYFIGNTLYAGLDFVKYQGRVKYSLGVNTVKANELKYQYADDVRLKIKAIQVNKDNTKLEAEIGDPKGESRTLYFYTAKSVEDLKKLAAVEINKYKFNGYVGKITAFLEPFCLPGYVAELIDEKYNERKGNYEIRSVGVEFSTSGGRRIVEIGKSVSI